MRDGFLGVVASLLVAGTAWGQAGPVDPLPGPLPADVGFGGFDEGPQGHTSPNVPPNFAGASDPYGGISYPPPMNWESADPNGLPGNYRPYQPARYWTDIEYLLWWAKPGTTNYPIATTGAAGTGGVLTQNSTEVLYNTNNIAYNALSGFRGFIGAFVDEDRRMGFEMGALFFAQSSAGFFEASNLNGTPLLARPYINTATGQQDSVIVANPGSSDGSILSRTTINFWGLEANGVFNYYRSFPGDIWGMDLNALVGFRFLDFTETMNITSVSNATNQGGNVNLSNNQTFVGNFTTTIVDQWRTISQFYGANLGLTGNFRYDRWTVNTSFKLGLGDMHEIFEVTGNTIQSTAVGNLINTGGILTNANNIGKYSHDSFAAVPEFTLKIGYRVTRYMTASIGYDLLYISQVARPGNMVNGQADPRLIPAAPQYGFATNSGPQYLQPQTDFWLMGLTFSMNFTF
jgi:hypothetical protein